MLRLHRTEVPHKKGKTNRSVCLLIDFLKDTAFISSAQYAKIRVGTQTHFLLRIHICMYKYRIQIHCYKCDLLFNACIK